MISRSLGAFLSTVLSGAIFLLMFSSNASADLDPSSEQTTITITIGALISATGELEDRGHSRITAINLAVQDINDYLSNVGSSYRVQVLSEDTESSADVALDKLKLLKSKGVQVVVGPSSSEVLLKLKPFADANEILLISPSSTAPSLAIPGDNILRFCPNDRHQAKAVTAFMQDSGYKTIVILNREDLWAEDWVKVVKKEFTHAGGSIFAEVSYPPKTKNFSTFLKDVNTQVQDAVNANGRSSVAVCVAAYGEIARILAQAQAYSALQTVSWVGADAAALNRDILKDPKSALFAAKVAFTAPIYGGDSNNSLYTRVVQNIQSITGGNPDSYSVGAYDAVWTTALAYLVTGHRNFEGLKKAIWRTAESYFGATGWTALDHAGDRRLFHYDFWRLVRSKGRFAWEDVATFNMGPGMPGVLVWEEEVRY